MLTTMPVQRRLKLSQKSKAHADSTTLEWNRIGNVEAVNAYLRGTMLSRKDWCSGCKDGKGFFEGCVVVQGRMTGACANHWINSKQGKCDLSMLVFFFSSFLLTCYIMLIIMTVSTKEQTAKKRTHSILDDDENPETGDQEVLVIHSDNDSHRVTPRARKQRKTTQSKKEVAIEIPSHGGRKLRSTPTKAAATATPKSSTQKPAASKSKPPKKSESPRKKAQPKTTSSISVTSSTASTISQLATRGGIPSHRVKEIQESM
jgi:hypothetical protein